MVDKINLAEKFSLFTERWSPKIIGRVNDVHIKIGKIQDEFLWHSHDNEDEMFMVINGCMTLKFRDRDVVVSPGEFIVVPRGVEHMPTAEHETQILMIEPVTTVNTGGTNSNRTVIPDTI